MAEETVFTAARRIARFLRIDDAKGGGLISQDTLVAFETLDRQIAAEDARLKREGAAAQPEGATS